jgi:hypothetical protein
MAPRPAIWDDAPWAPGSDHTNEPDAPKGQSKDLQPPWVPGSDHTNEPDAPKGKSKDLQPPWASGSDGTNEPDADKQDLQDDGLTPARRQHLNEMVEQSEKKFFIKKGD